VHDDGTIASPLDRSSAEKWPPVRFIMVINQAVSVQVEKAISMISMLVARQKHIADVVERNADATELDREVAATDAIATNEVADVLRHGWRAGAELVARQAIDAGFRLQVSYEADAVRSREELNRRGGALRRAYNELPLARNAVDRFVSGLASGLILRAPPGTPESIQTMVSQRLSLGSYKQYMAQALRDAFVTGNGYLAFTETDPPAAYNLRPTEAEPAGDHMVTPRAGAKPVRALHLRGMLQPGVAYGLGLLEVALPALADEEMFAEILAKARPFEGSDIGEAREWARKTKEQADRSRAAHDRSLREMFSPLLAFLPEPEADLYFPGSEQL
jgi:hypothetical protein